MHNVEPSDMECAVQFDRSPNGVGHYIFLSSGAPY